MKFKNQLVCITGASRGIGRAIAEAFAAEGATVIGTATTSEGANQISSYLKKYHNKNEGMILEASDPEQCKKLINHIFDHYGTPHVFINNAGITRDNLLLRMQQSEWDDVLNINLNALFSLCKLVIKPMIKAHYGRIINISSVVGATGNPGQANYAAAKAGMIGFSKALAREVASRNITVNVVAPGFIETNMTKKLNETQQKLFLSQIPVQRFGLPEDIARAVLFFADPQNNYITGQTLHVNGGLYMD